MKKTIFLFLILFMCILTVKADDTFYLGQKVPSMYVEVIKGNNVHNGAPFLLHRSDGSLVYCINPFKLMSTTDIYKSYTYNDPIFNLTDEQLNRLNVISYYGYGYQNHNDIKWFGITQYFMWKSLNFDDVYFTDVFQGIRVERYQNEVNELEDLVNKHYTLPSFSNQNYEYSSNSSYELIDYNNVLSNYEIKESNISAGINGNKLSIKTSGNGKFYISFIRKSPINRDYILYNLDGSQNLIYPGKINDITFRISIEVNSGAIIINKFDSENKNRLEANLNDSIFGIYKNNILVKEVKTNNNGNVSINNLPLGDYVVRELRPSKGYNIDTNIYNVTISKTNKNIIINSYSEVIEGNLIIEKYYGSDNDYKLDSSAIFEVYHNNSLISTLNNQDKIKLEYGTYTVKQVSGKKYYDLINDFNLSILEEKDYKYDFYTDKTDEIKAYEDLLNKKEESLNQREENLKEEEIVIEEEKKGLIELKEEINQKENELNNKREKLNEIEEELKQLEEYLNNLNSTLDNEREEIDRVNQELTNDREILSQKEDEIKEREEELNNLKDELESKASELDTKEENLNELENNISQKEEKLKEHEKELELEKDELDKKEKNLSELENSIDEKGKELNEYETGLDLRKEELGKKEEYLTQLEINFKEKELELEESKKELDLLSKELSSKEQLLNKLKQDLEGKENDIFNREQTLIKLENKKEDVLVVEVPNTYKRNYNKLISIILIFIGSILIIYSKKKTTSC